MAKIETLPYAFRAVAFKKPGQSSRTGDAGTAFSLLGPAPVHEPLSAT